MLYKQQGQATRKQIEDRCLLSGLLRAKERSEPTRDEIGWRGILRMKQNFHASD
jgi:hypothetical protein